MGEGDQVREDQAGVRRATASGGGLSKCRTIKSVVTRLAGIIEVVRKVLDVIGANQTGLSRITAGYEVDAEREDQSAEQRDW
jgi:hypothetical protein